MSDEDLLKRELAREREARKAAERLLEEKSRELYHRNQELQREVGERERVELALRAQAEHLQRANAELEQFAHVASHDLQAPLRGILSFSQLLDRKLGPTLDAEGREYVDFIVECARRMHQLIADLLEFSRAGRVDLRADRIDLGVLIPLALKPLRATLEATRASVDFAGLPAVMGDAGSLIQLFQNLIENGVKYVAPGVRPQLRITAGPQDDRVVIRVIDNGIGIAPEHQDRIFQIFQRLHAQEYPGTGVGLAICQKLVERHGGKLWVESQPGQGSAFCFDLSAATDGPTA